MSRCYLIFAAAVLLVCVGALSAAATPAAAGLKPINVPLAAGFCAQRCLLAGDEQGRTFVLSRAVEGLYRVSETGLGDLATAAPRAAALDLVQLAVADGGGTWAVRELGGSVHLFRSEKRVPLPAGAELTVGVSLLRGDLVVVMPPGLVAAEAALPGQEVGAPATRGPLTWVQRFDGKRWERLAEAPEAVGPGDLRSATPADIVQRSLLVTAETLITPGARGRLWLARAPAYRVWQLSPAGAVLSELTVENGLPREEEVAVTGSTTPRRRLARALHSLTEAPDGRLYLLAGTPRGLALDRFDPVRQVLERLELSGIEPVRSQLAATSTALLLLPLGGVDQLAVLTFEQLEKAEWKVIEGARVDGVLLAPQAPRRGQVPNEGKPQGGSR